MKSKRFQLVVWWAIASLGGGCAMQQAVSQESPAPTEDIPVMSSGTTNEGQQRRLVLKLTLASQSDLLVQQGQTVQAGDVMADRVNDRTRLQAQLDKILLQIQQVSAPVPMPAPVRAVPEIAGLPPANYAAEVAEVERQRVLIASKEREITQQQRLIDMLDSLPDAQVPEATIPHEQEVMAQLGRELAEAQSELVLAEGQLRQAQTDRQYQEYEYSVTVANRQSQIAQAELQRSAQQQRYAEDERDRQFKLSQLEAEKGQLEAQLFQLSAIRAPFTGTIQRINWKGQNDQNLVVEITLIGSADGGDGSGMSLLEQGGDTDGEVPEGDSDGSGEE